MKSALTIIFLLALASCGKGPAGKDGINGLNGLDGTNGQDGIQGEAGKDGKDGEKGDKGDKGEAGQDGLTKVVKFCPGLVDAYSKQYSEQGLCIDGKVYAVYSSNNLAALVEISHGTYITTTPKGKNCQFEVKADCEVVVK